MERAGQRGIEGLGWAEENAEQLSFADAAFDAYTIAFGIRNVTDIPAALARSASRAEARRAAVRARILDQRLARLRRGLCRLCRPGHPELGKAVADDEESYRYLVEVDPPLSRSPTRSAG